MEFGSAITPLETILALSPKNGKKPAENFGVCAPRRRPKCLRDLLAPGWPRGPCATRLGRAKAPTCRSGLRAFQRAYGCPAPTATEPILAIAIDHARSGGATVT